MGLKGVVGWEVSTTETQVPLQLLPHEIKT
jgi:hypothetical protein